MDSNLKKYLVAAGAIGLSYALANYFFSQRQNPISLSLTKKITQQIKHQMLIACVNFSLGIQNHVKAKIGSIKQNQQKITEYLLEEINLILKKYIVSPKSYQLSLKIYEKDETISKNTQQMFDMMTRAANGKTPNLQVPREAIQTFGRQQLRRIYKDMCITIATLVVNKLLSQMDKDPYFDCTDDNCFRKAIRQLSIYDVKVKLLRSKGFEPQWGCPNQIFFKVIQTKKLDNAQYRKQMTLIQKAYEKIIQIASNDPKKIDVDKIQEFFKQKMQQRSQSHVSKSMINPSSVQRSQQSLVQHSAPQSQKGVNINNSQQEVQQNILTSIRSQEKKPIQSQQYQYVQQKVPQQQQVVPQLQVKVEQSEKQQAQDKQQQGQEEQQLKQGQLLEQPKEYYYMQQYSQHTIQNQDEKQEKQVFQEDKKDKVEVVVQEVKQNNENGQNILDNLVQQLDVQLESANNNNDN